MTDSPVLTLVLAAAAVVAVALIGALVWVLRDREAARRRVEALFRRPPRAPRPPGRDHYYRPYWSR